MEYGQSSFITDCISEGGNAITSVCLSICFHSICGTNWPLTLKFCMWVGHNHSSQGLKVKVRLMWSVWPRWRAVFLVHTVTINSTAGTFRSLINYKNKDCEHVIIKDKDWHSGQPVCKLHYKRMQSIGNNPLQVHRQTTGNCPTVNKL